jgi:hypothetical protein
VRESAAGVRTRKVLCVGIHCQLRYEAGRSRHRVLADCLICLVCREKLTSGLSSLIGLYAECGRLLDATGGGPAALRAKVSGRLAPGLPFNARAAETRTEILDVLEAWSAMVVDERRVSPPRRGVVDLAEFLRRHVDWIAAHPAAADATDEVARLVRSARQVVDPVRVRRVPIGTCVERGCDGQLHAVVSLNESSAPAQISCDVESGHSWSEHQWYELSRLLARESSGGGGSGPQAPRWLSAADIARLWRIPSASVYRFASEQEWRRHKQAGRTFYHAGDVQDTLSQRA